MHMKEAVSHEWKEAVQSYKLSGPTSRRLRGRKNYDVFYSYKKRKGDVSFNDPHALVFESHEKRKEDVFKSRRKDVFNSCKKRKEDVFYSYKKRKEDVFQSYRRKLFSPTSCQGRPVVD